MPPRLRHAVIACASVSAVAAFAASAEEPVGSVELVDSQVRRVASLNMPIYDASHFRRIDAPPGSAFLIVRLDLKPTYAEDENGRLCVTIPEETVGVEGEGWKTDSDIRVEIDGSISSKPRDRVAYPNDYRPVTTIYEDFAFAIPADAKRATFKAADIELDLALDEPILPRVDWRDYLKIENLRAYRISPPKREDFARDSLANLEYRWDIVYGKPDDSLVVVEFQATATRGNGAGQAHSLELRELDFRVDYGAQRLVAPLFAYPEYQNSEERGPYELGSVVTCERGEDGSLRPLDLAYAYRLYEPAEKLTLTYRGSSLGEVAIEDER